MPTLVQTTITIPGEYLDDVRTALTLEIEDDGEALAHAGPEDRASSARILRRHAELLDQLLDASGETTVTAPPGDVTSDPIAEMLQSMTRLLSKRLEDVCQYAPTPMGDVLEIAERLEWAAEEAIRACPSLAESEGD